MPNADLESRQRLRAATMEGISRLSGEVLQGGDSAVGKAARARLLELQGQIFTLNS